jgi:hypothetical protein
MERRKYVERGRMTRENGEDGRGKLKSAKKVRGGRRKAKC